MCAFSISFNALYFSISFNAFYFTKLRYADLKVQHRQRIFVGTFNDVFSQQKLWFFSRNPKWELSCRLSLLVVAKSDKESALPTDRSGFRGNSEKQNEEESQRGDNE